MAQEAEITAVLTAENTFTTPAVSFEPQSVFNVSVSGITGTTIVTLQRSFDGGATFRDTDSFDADTEGVGDNAEENTLWRIGVKTGDYDTGTVTVRLGQ